MKVGQIQTISGYTFERLSDEEYSVTSPNGSTQVKYYLAAENLMKQLKNKQNGNTTPKSEVYSPNQPEYHKLKAFAESLNAFQDNYTFELQNCYKDMGAGLTWTTVVATRKKDGSSYMFLTPAEQKDLLTSSYTEFSKLTSTTLSKLKRK